MARNHRRMARPPKLNLVALMDIFTILVLFLIYEHRMAANLPQICRSMGHTAPAPLQGEFRAVMPQTT